MQLHQEQSITIIKDFNLFAWCILSFTDWRISPFSDLETCFNYYLICFIYAKASIYTSDFLLWNPTHLILFTCLSCQEEAGDSNAAQVLGTSLTERRGRKRHGDVTAVAFPTPINCVVLLKVIINLILFIATLFKHLHNSPLLLNQPSVLLHGVIMRMNVQSAPDEFLSVSLLDES